MPPADYVPENNTLLMIKPDGRRRGLVGEILRRVEQKGLELYIIDTVDITNASARELYREHIGQDYFDRLIDNVTASPVLMVWVRGPNAVAHIRTMQGPSHAAAPGTIRGDFMLERPNTVTHCSDSPEAAQRELSLFFGI